MTRTTEVLLDTADLRAALLAVRPHASTHKDDHPALRGLRLRIEPPHHVYVMATDRYTLGLARVSVWEDIARYGDQGTVEIDLTADDCTDVLRIFRAPSKDDSARDERIRVRVDDPLTLTLTDASGLFADPDPRQLVLPVALHEGFPDVLRIMSRQIRTAMDLLAESRDSAGAPVIAAPAALAARFTAAGKAYGEPLYHLQSAEARAALLYRVGQSFLGALMPLRIEDSEEAALGSTLRTWRQLLPRPGRAPVPMPDPCLLYTSDAADE